MPASSLCPCIAPGIPAADQTRPLPPPPAPTPPLVCPFWWRIVLPRRKLSGGRHMRGASSALPAASVVLGKRWEIRLAALLSVRIICRRM